MAVDVATTDLLGETWKTPRGVVGWLTAVNHKQVARRFLVTAFAFFAAGGIQALVMRWQLGAPENDFISAEVYNDLFTMHGTTMMFLFAVPVVEAFAIYLLPLMLGTRDLPFPRLTAFGYWTYLFGGLFLYASFFSGRLPDTGWFAYPPLSAKEFSPGPGMDFWLLGITFVEISALVGALELVVVILRNRAPGMAISRIPLFAWSILAMSGMILFAFPPLLVGSILLELQRLFAMPFYDPAAGGDPLLWQHLFWWFGHPEVYIMLLPAVGIVSTIVPVFARRPIVGYTFLVASTLTIAFVSFGLWVHHMFTVGIELLPASLFTAGSLMIVIPSGLQIFAWIATLWRGRVVWSTPLLYVVGFIILFVLGGMTGVMVASVPFDRQAHDSYFVVAHFHYVLIGGVVFPALAGLHFWFPKITGRMLSETLGAWSFWTTFLGFNLTFFPLHIVGLLGMPRRVYTWHAGIGWEPYNALATVGAFVLATGFVLTGVNVVRSLRQGRKAGADPWGGETLEWAVPSPPPSYNHRTIPIVTSRSPLFERPMQARGEAAAGEALSEQAGDTELQRELAQATEQRREVLVTSVMDARPDGVTNLPQKSWWPLIAALFIGVGLTGVMANRPSLSLVGVLGVTIALVAWVWTPEDEPL